MSGITFALKGNTSKIVYGAYSASKLEIQGQFVCQGPQPVGTDGGCPQWVAELFDSNPKIDYVALGGEESGSVYCRMKG